MPDHDHSYKRLFSHAEMVADLLRGFVHEDWVRELDFSTLQKVNAVFIGDDLTGRDSDVVWRLRWGKDRWLYVYLLVEFQSTVDPLMALRVMIYVGLLYQDLIRQGIIPADGKLPPVLPFVLYNGIPPWNAAQEIAELIEAVPGGLERYRPQLRYFLLDEGRLADSALSPMRNLAAALFRLEKSRGPEEIQAVVAALLEWLEQPQQAEMKRAFGTWLTQVLLPARLPGIAVPGVTELQEVRSMLAERVREWTEDWRQQGLQEGRQEGLDEARHALLLEVERRFGPVPDATRQRIAEVCSFAELVALTARVATAPSLAEIGLA